MDYKKFAMVLMEVGNTVRVASNDNNSITIIQEDLGSLGTFLVLWVYNACHVYPLIDTRKFDTLMEGLQLNECGIAEAVWPVEEYNTMFD